MPRLLRAERGAGIGRSHKAIINVLLPGGPPHQDMVDRKPDAPSDIRGEFKPIGTNVPGIQISEHMQRMAKMKDKFTKKVRLLGEDLILYRDRSGSFGLIEPHCAHRRMNMIYGIPEENGRRCPYHGWLYDETGQCTEHQVATVSELSVTVTR